MIRVILDWLIILLTLATFTAFGMVSTTLILRAFD